MPKQKKSTTTTTTSTTPTPLRRSPRFHPLTPQNPTGFNDYSQNPRPDGFLVCGISAIGLKTSPSLRNAARVSKCSEILGGLDSGLRRSTRFKKRVYEGLSVRRSPRLVSKGNSDKPLEKCVNNKLNKKRCCSRKAGGTKGGEEEDAEGREKVNEIREAEKDVREEVKVRRKRKRGEQCTEGVGRGWTKEQEVALQRAYFAAKPTPHFWKKVSKLVPGKSAQDCFDKIHSDHVTPLQPLPRSRARKMNSSPIGSLSLSASKLLNSSGKKTKRPISNKQKNRLVHKTVRQLLQKCNRVKQNYEVDMFSALEPTVNLSIQDSEVNPVLSTPKPLQEKQKFLQKCDEKDSDLERLPSKSSLCRKNIVSPPVLKQVKNRALHEKYIDHLHAREAKRNAAAKRAGRMLGGKENLEQTNIQNVDIVKTAKEALVSDARDGIKQLEHLQANATETCTDFDDDCVDSLEDEAECRSETTPSWNKV